VAIPISVIDAYRSVVFRLFIGGTISLKAFLRSPAGKATVAVYAAGLLLAWPPALSWLVAAILLAVAVKQFCTAFTEAEPEADAPAVRIAAITAVPASAGAVGNKHELCDAARLSQSMPGQ
jgi:hypothetical protein